MPKWSGNVARLASGWYVRFRDVNGRWTRRASHQATRAGAVAFLEDIKARVRRGDAGFVDPTPADRERKTITVREIADRFLGDVKDVPGYAPPRIKSIKNYRRDARSILTVRIIPALGSRPASEVTPMDIERFRDSLSSKPFELAAASVVQTLAVLSKVYTWARRSSFVDCANPVAGIERPRTNHSIDFLDAAEVSQLLARVEEAATVGVASWQSLTLAPMVATAIYCGLRKGELFGLRWRDLDLDAARLDVNRSYDLLPKSGKARHVPMHPELVRILREWKKVCPKCDDLVFPVETRPFGGQSIKPRDTDLRMGVKLDTLEIASAFTSAGCHAPADGKCWHMLRHTFASHFIMSGGSLFTLQRLLGHSTPTVTQRYAHLAPEYLASEVARLNFATPAPAGVADMNEERRKRAAT